jgi:hypothetical protein
MALDTKTHNIFVDTADFRCAFGSDGRSSSPTADSNSRHVPCAGLRTLILSIETRGCSQQIKMSPACSK